MESKVCESCLRDLPLTKYHKGGSGKLKPTCHECYNNRYKARLKLDVFGHFGFRCKCCGEGNPYFLTLDHVVAIGSLGRNGRNREQLYEECRGDNYDPSKYQLLCMNCNFAKGIFGSCPHSRGINEHQAISELFVKAGIDPTVIAQLG